MSLLADLVVVNALGIVVNKFLEAWLKIEKIRRVRAELTEMGMKGKAVEELSEQITRTVDEVVEESTTFLLSNHKGDGNRKSELGNAIRQDAHRLFGQIERGLTVEFRAEPQANASADEQKLIGVVSDLRKQLHFPRVAIEPMLLGSGEIIEGEIKSAKHTKKTTTTQKTSTKETAKESKVDAKG